MTSSALQKLERELSEQAEHLTGAPVVVPTEALLAMHHRRNRRRRIRVVANASIGIALLAVAWRNLPHLADQRDPLHPVIVADAPTSVPAGKHTIDTENGDENDALLKLVELISARLDTQAELITVIDRHGVKQPAIYVPQRVVPVHYQDLSPAEQSAVLRILNEPVGVLGSI